jgi:hypothetical protein
VDHGDHEHEGLCRGRGPDGARDHRQSGAIGDDGPWASS